MTLYEQLQHDAQPAVALYRFWKGILDAMGRRCMAFGDHGWGLELKNDDTIACGRYYGWYVNWYLLLNPDGRFLLANMRGFPLRRQVARNVPFLGFGHTHSRYQWYVEFDPDAKGGLWTRQMTDWEQPRHYVNEDLLGIRLYGQRGVWCELRHVDEAWRIAPSTVQHNGSVDADAYGDLTDQWEHYERITQNRYRRRRKYETGEALVLSVRVPTIRTGGQVLTHDQAVNRLVALLEVEAPAKTTPLKRLKEAPHGNNHVAP